MENAEYRNDPDVIATTHLVGVDASGRRQEILVEIGRPYCDNSFFRCPVALHGLHDELVDIAGEDSFQSLCLAVELIRRLLNDFVADGGRLLLPGGKEIDVISLVPIGVS